VRWSPETNALVEVAPPTLDRRTLAVDENEVFTSTAARRASSRATRTGGTSSTRSRRSTTRTSS